MRASVRAPCFVPVRFDVFDLMCFEFVSTNFFDHGNQHFCSPYLRCKTVVVVVVTFAESPSVCECVLVTHTRMALVETHVEHAVTSLGFGDTCFVNS